MTSICLVYFFYDTREYERINSIFTFFSTTLPLFLVTCGYIYVMTLGSNKGKERLFKIIVLFLVGIGITILVYEFIKPRYTYVEAQHIVAQEYNVEVIDSHFTTSIQLETGKEIYSMTAIKDSQQIKIVFDPYTKEIILLK